MLQLDDLSNSHLLDEYSNADGAGKNAICRAGCSAKHPFSRGKRETCREFCDMKNPPSANQTARRGGTGGFDLPSPTPPPPIPQEDTYTGSGEDESTDKKFLGMPKALGITVTVVVALGLIIGGIVLVKKLNK